MEDSEFNTHHHFWIGIQNFHHCLSCPAGDGVLIPSFSGRDTWHSQCKEVKMDSIENAIFIANFVLDDGFRKYLYDDDEEKMGSEIHALVRAYGRQIINKERNGYEKWLKDKENK